MTDTRKCPICHDGWEQDGRDVRKCRACGGSALLGPVIPELTFCEPTRMQYGYCTLEVAGRSFEIEMGDTAEDIADKINAALPGMVSVSDINECGLIFEGESS